MLHARVLLARKDKSFKDVVSVLEGEYSAFLLPPRSLSYCSRCADDADQVRLPKQH